MIFIGHGQLAMPCRPARRDIIGPPRIRLLAQADDAKMTSRVGFYFAPELHGHGYNAIISPSRWMAIPKLVSIYYGRVSTCMHVHDYSAIEGITSARAA